MHRLWGFAVLLAAGCLRENLQYCDNGAICPDPLVCTERTEAPFCGMPGQVEGCMGMPEETACTVDNKKGVCHTGICTECVGNDAACIYDDWVAMEPPVQIDLVALWVAGPRDVYAAGRMGTVIHWDGRQWTTLPATGTTDLTAFTGASANDLWAASSSITYHFDGTAWTAQASVANPIFGMWAAGPNDFFSAGFRSTIGRYTGGATWSYTQDVVPTNVSLNALWGTGTNDVYAVGGAGSVVHWNGMSWSAPEPTPAAHVLLGVSGSSSTNIFTVGRTVTAAQAPIVFRYDGTWQDQTANLPPTLVAYLRGVYTTPNHVIAVGEQGKIVHSTDNGASWSLMANNTTSALQAIAGSGKYVFAVGATGTVLRYQMP